MEIQILQRYKLCETVLKHFSIYNKHLWTYNSVK